VIPAQSFFFTGKISDLVQGVDSMAGKRQKPAEKLVDRRPSRTPAEISVMPERERKPPKAPAGLHPVARRAWRSFWTSPVSDIVDREADWEAICRWAYCLSERELLEEELREHPLVPGNRGGQIRNPLWPILKERELEVARFRELFGMTPLHRMRLGITYSEADDALARMEARRRNVAPVIVEVDGDQGGETKGSEHD
jgi:phage terminase small subunit